MNRIILSVLPLLLVPGIRAQDSICWPAFHGPQRNNISRESGLPGRWPENGPLLAWKAGGIGEGYSSVAVCQGKILTAGIFDSITHVVCLDMEGTLRWKSANGTSWKAGENQQWAVSYSGSRCTPTIDGNTVYHLSELGQLGAFDLHTGDRIWTRNIRQEFRAPIPKYGFSESLFVDDSHVYCCPAGGTAHMVALDKQTGEGVWKNSDLNDPAGYASVVPARIHGVKQLISVSADHVFAVKPSDGELLWKYPFGNDRNNNATDAIVDGDRVFVSSGYGKGCVMLQISAGENGVLSPRKVWETEKMDNHHGGVILYGEHLYGSGHRSRGWFCLEAATGNPVWQHPGKGSLTLAGEHLYLVDEDGTITLLPAVPGGFKPAGEFTIEKEETGPFWAHPVVAGGRLYIRHGGILYAFEPGKSDSF